MARAHSRFLFAALLALAPFAAPAEDIPQATLEKEIGNLDAIFFDAFNHCADPDRLGGHAVMLDPKLEFYHDQGGVSWTSEAYLDSVRKNVCGKFARELVPGSMKVFPIKDFGALSTGTHRFCHFDSGRCEGEAEFAIVWHLDEHKRWTITRVLSYAHREMPDRPPPLPGTPTGIASGAVQVAATQASTKVEMPAAPPALLPKPATSCYNTGQRGEEQLGYCHALRIGDTLYISGVAAGGGMKDAIASVYGSLQETLRQHGLSLAHVVKENVYATKLDDFIAASELRKQYYAGAAPASSWVQVDRLFAPEYVLEVELVVAFPR